MQVVVQGGFLALRGGACSMGVQVFFLFFFWRFFHVAQCF